MLAAIIKKPAEEDFVSAIVHELKTPISAIIGFSEALEDEVKNPKFAEECAYYAKEINLASMELLEIVRDLLDVGSSHSGNFSVDLSQEIDVVDVARRAIRLNWDYSLKRNVKLKFEVAGQEILVKSNVNQGCSDAIPRLHLDAKRMKQILTNLISNSVKYSAAKTEVKISVRVISSKNISNENYQQDTKPITTNQMDEQPASICLHYDQLNATTSPEVIAKNDPRTITTSEECGKTQPASSRFMSESQQILEIIVEDQGFGMSKNQLSCLFKRYQTFQNPNSGKVDSTGLGLSITKELVEMQGGQIAVESQLGKGSKFTLNFPV